MQTRHALAILMHVKPTARVDHRLNQTVTVSCCFLLNVRLLQCIVIMQLREGLQKMYAVKISPQTNCVCSPTVQHGESITTRSNKSRKLPKGTETGRIS